MPDNAKNLLPSTSLVCHQMGHLPWLQGKTAFIYLIFAFIYLIFANLPPNSSSTERGGAAAMNFQ